MICLKCNHYINPDREMEIEQNSAECQCPCHPWNKRICPGCQKEFDKEDLIKYYDKHNIYSGFACSDECAKVLPGQGEMWDYDDSLEQIEDDY